MQGWLTLDRIEQQTITSAVAARHARPPLHRAAGLLLVLSLLFVQLSAPLSHSASAQEWSPPPTVYIPETGHTLDQVFLDQWRAAGGAISYGYPITPEITLADGTVVQYLQYARFEYYPNGNSAGEYFGLGDIGAELRDVGVAQMYSSVADGTSGFGQALGISTAFTDAWLPAPKSSTPDDGVYVDATSHTIRAGFLDFWQSTGETAYLGNPLTEEYVVDGITYQVFERGQLAWQEGSYPWMVPVGQILADWYGLDQSAEPQGNIPTYSEDLFVPPPPPPVVQATDPGPGPVPGAAKSIVVSLSQQELWAYEGDTVVLSTLVSTGRAGFETPSGMFSIVVKKPSENMEGVIGGEYYNVPEVPDVMYFTDVGHALHGTYWHNNFGTPMSHGCVNLPMDVAAWMYDWAPIGTPVLILP